MAPVDEPRSRLDSLPPDDPRRDPEFAILWAAMAESDWLEFLGEEDSPQLRLLLDAHRQFVFRRRIRRILIAVLALACGATVLLFFL
jgi:hypothetical protein